MLTVVMADRQAIWDFLGNNWAILVPLTALTGAALLAAGAALRLGVPVANSADSAGDRSVYDAVQGYAYLVKAILQMLIGVVAVAIVGWKFLHHPPPIRAAQGETGTSLLLDGIGVGLAAAAVVELAYTLFTSGPDEALDPLMLGLSAALLIQLGALQVTGDVHPCSRVAGIGCATCGALRDEVDALGTTR